MKRALFKNFYILQIIIETIKHKNYKKFTLIKKMKENVYKRYVNDKWALILFLVFTTVFNIYLSQIKPQVQLFQPVDVKMLSVGFAYTMLCSAIFLYIMLIAAQKAMIYLFLLAPIIKIFLLFLIKNPVFHVASTILGLLSCAYYFLAYRKNIKGSSHVVSAVATILYKRKLSIFAVSSCIILILYAQVQNASSNLHYNYKSFIGAYSLTSILLYWVFFTCVYWLRIFVSSIVALDVLMIDNSVNVPLESLKNTLYSMGTICFASLISAISFTAHCLESFIKYNKKNTNKNRKRNTHDRSIFVIFLTSLIAILHRVAISINYWTLPHVALHGKDYKTSVIESLKISGSRGTLLKSVLTFDPIVTVYSISCMFGYVFVVRKFSTDLAVKPDSLLFTENQFLFQIMLVFILLSVILSAFSDGIKSLLYVFDHDKNAVKNKFPKAYEIIETHVKTSNI
ncbi:hypothetical protein EDEG_00265 [Edhazardia aedis USNM 41457]|uniref:Protein PNS1 n=1 Tax=Edhazardia aedis (strain USNM 41457) TaxID=1003232 RepID=J9D4A2_EDHAE|nr:hypothetical protein EDEG_00265 [Edhazardia aedis USNM 41457]|eukprot:EJW02611.1 hypothetical protein EDEG_00265 [Edhazardia aedis USNM 41457]